MPRTRRARPDLSESWEDVDDEYRLTDSASEEHSEEERNGRKGQTPRSRNGAARQQESPRKRATRSSVEPELIMPSSPNAVNGKSRAKTPHFRLNDRSMTSDAGNLDAGRKIRSQSQRSRILERSMTSDAGKFTRLRSKLGEEVDVDEGLDDSLSGYATMMWNRILKPVVAYLSDIVGQVLSNAKPLIAYALFAYLLAAALIFGSGFLTNTINNALSPICRIPGVTRFFDPSFCEPYQAPEVAGPAEFDKLVQAQSAFNEVLAASSSGVNLPLDMKRSEAGIRDLKHVVQYSQLPSKNELVFEFGGFIATAKEASQDLSKFNSRIGGAVDRILSTNRWTLNVIDGIASDRASRGTVSRFFSDHLNIFAPFQPLPLSQDILMDQYLRHTSAIEDQILSLISEAQSLLAILENMDLRLDVIAEIATRDDIHAAKNRDELLAYLWTKLGGNRASVKKLNGQIELLKDVQQYKRMAWAHVTSTVVKLQAIRNNLEDLRERVALPETVGSDKVPLEVHIEAINLGIQRLEEQRDTSRRMEHENHRRVMERAEAAVDGRMIADREL